jgi:hypothetical protein
MDRIPLIAGITARPLIQVRREMERVPACEKGDFRRSVSWEWHAHRIANEAATSNTTIVHTAYLCDAVMNP